MWGSKGTDLLTADKVVTAGEKSVQALDSCPGYDEPPEKSAGKESAETLKPGFFHSSSRNLDGYADNGDLVGIYIGRQQEEAQVGTNYWLGARNCWQLKLPQRKVNRQHIQGGGMLTDAGARGASWVRTNVGLSASMQSGQRPFSVIQTNTQRNGTTVGESLLHSGKLFQRLTTNATRNISGNGGRP
jgi:hypothetical protein